MGRHAAGDGVVETHPLVARALQRRQASGDGLGWPGDVRDGEGLGWPGHRAAQPEDTAEHDAHEDARGAGVEETAEQPGPRRLGWRRIFGLGAGHDEGHDDGHDAARRQDSSAA